MSDAEIDAIFSKVYAHCVVKYDPEAGKRVLREALAKPASSPAGDVREASLSRSDVCRLWQYAVIERPSMTVEGFTNLLLAEIDDRAEALSAPTSAAEPVAFMAYDQMRAITQRELDTIPEANGRRSNCKALYPTALYATPPAPAAVDGQRVKALAMPEEPDDIITDAIRKAWRETRTSGVSGMTIDAQWRAEYARELAVYRAIRACLATDKEGDDVRNR